MLFRRSDPTPAKDGVAPTAPAAAAPTTSVTALASASNNPPAAAAPQPVLAASPAPPKDTLPPAPGLSSFSSRAPGSSGPGASAGASAALPAPAAPRERQAATIRYIDRPDVAEMFADSVSGLVFDGQSLRLEFAVTRLDEVKPDTPITGRRYPVSRLVLSPAAALELVSRMQQIGAVLAPAGAAKKSP